MGTEQKLKLNNEGFSLVELIVAVLLMGFVMTIVLMFISTSRRSYEIVNTDTTLQNEAQIAATYINELLLEAEDCGLESYGEAKILWIKAPYNGSDETVPAGGKSYFYYIIRESAGTGALRFAKEAADSVSTDSNGRPVIPGPGAAAAAISDPYSLLAEHVSDISCERRGDLIKVVISLSYNGTDYETTLSVSGRNLKGGSL